MNNTEFQLSEILTEYLQSIGLYDEVISLITTCRENNPKRWAKTKDINALNTAFDWDMPNRGFDFWEGIHTNLTAFILQKKLAAIKIDQNVSEFVNLMHPKLVEFLLQYDCLSNFIINCINFVEKYGKEFVSPPPTIESHLTNVRDILNAFRFSETPEGTDFWKDITEKFVSWRG